MGGNGVSERDMGGVGRKNREGKVTKLYFKLKKKPFYFIHGLSLDFMTALEI